MHAANRPTPLGSLRSAVPLAPRACSASARAAPGRRRGARLAHCLAWRCTRRLTSLVARGRPAAGECLVARYEAWTILSDSGFGRARCLGCPMRPRRPRLHGVSSPLQRLSDEVGARRARNGSPRAGNPATPCPTASAFTNVSGTRSSATSTSADLANAENAPEASFFGPDEALQLLREITIGAALLHAGA